MTQPPRLVSAGELGRLRQAFAGSLPAAGQVEPRLQAVLADLLRHPGSLGRAQLAFGIATAEGLAAEPARRLAVAIEYFHSASLVFDDLPAMDDAAERRGRPCPHRTHGEAAAILGALGLITRAYGLLWETLAPLPVERRLAAAVLVERSLGVAGLLDGQSRDLHFAAQRAPGGASGAETALAVARGKTVPLIRLAIVLPAVVAGSSAATLASLERLAESWGLAYQALDDLKDELLTAAESGKTAARDRLLGRPSLSRLAGERAARERLDSLLAEAAAALQGPALASAARRPLVRLQGHFEAEAAALDRRAAGRRCA